MRLTLSAVRHGLPGSLAVLGLAWALSALPGPAVAQPEVPAVGAAAFLNSIGVNTHVDQGYDPESYVDPLIYTGIRQVRDGDRNIAADLMIHRKTGVQFTITDGGDLEALLSAARSLAAANALLALDGPNEPNNFPIVYEGQEGGGAGGSWIAVARYQQALYARVKADSALGRYPVFGPSEAGAETDNVGLQFLAIPAGADTLSAPGTRFADYANVHNYVSGNGGGYEDNQAWKAADPTLNAHWDGLYGNHGVTWHRHYRGYGAGQLPALPRVTTETGWDTKANPGGERTQGIVLINTYLAQFKRGWAYTFVYELRDGEGSEGEQGLYRGATPKLAAHYLHALTTILRDDLAVANPGSLRYALRDAPATVHDLLLRKSNGRFALIIWGERVRGTDAVTVDFAKVQKTVTIYDVTSGTAPIQKFTQAASVQLTVSDHALIIETAD